MTTPAAPFHESGPLGTPIRDLGLTLAGSSLEPILGEFAGELERAGLRKIRPRFYLSTEWGVPEGTVAIAIPFYLARPDLTALHAHHVGHVEGIGRADILRYLRHEMGHVVNYGYELFADPEWAGLFGPISAPYREDYRPEPFSRRHVRHLPGWYAQKHPDEDWSETFAVWMTPGLDWRAEYADWPVALAKLQYCDRTMTALGDRDPVVTANDLDEDVGDLDYSLDHFYRGLAQAEEPYPVALDSALRAVFEDLDDLREHADPGQPHALASALIPRMEGNLARSVYQWTGHFPERTRSLVRHLAHRAEILVLLYPEAGEARAVIALTTLVTALATNFVRENRYLP